MNRSEFMVMKIWSLVFLLLAASLAGCESAPVVNPAAVTQWQAGFGWTYESADGTKSFHAEVVSSNVTINLSSGYLLSWNATGGPLHAVAIDRDYAGRYGTWADPLVVVPCPFRQCYGGTRIDFSGRTLNIIETIPFNGGKYDATTNLSPSASWDWQYRGMTARLDERSALAGLHDVAVPGMGSVQALRIHYEFSITSPSVALQSYIDQRKAEGVDVEHFSVDADWGIEQRNFVHAVAHGGDGGAEAWHAGFIFDDGTDVQPAEYWLKTFSFKTRREWTDADILVTWGGPIAPSPWHRFLLSKQILDQNITIVGPPAQSGAWFSLDQATNVLYPDNATLIFRTIDRQGNLLQTRSVTGHDMQRGGSVSTISLRFAFDRPGLFGLNVTARSAEGEVWAQAEYPIRVQLHQTGELKCPAGTVEPLSVCPTFSFPAGRADLFKLHVSTPSLGGGVAVLKDAHGTILAQNQVNQSWDRTLDTFSEANLAGNWTLEWHPKFPQASTLEYDVTWTTR